MTTSAGRLGAAVEPDLRIEEMVREHMPLVGHLVRQLSTRIPAHVDRDDLTGTGLAALVTSAQAWDVERGVSFSRYATVRVRGALLDHLRSLDWASRSVRRRARELDDTRAVMAGQLGHAPSDVELAHATGMSLKELSAHAEDLTRSVVLSIQGFDDEQTDALVSRHAPAADTLLEQREQMAYLRDAVESLPERLRTIVRGSYFGDRTLSDIADELGITESRVSQLRSEALVLLKGAMDHALNPDLAATTERPNGCAARRRESYFAEVAAHRTFRERLDVSQHARPA